MIDFTLMAHQKTALWQSQFKPDLFLAWDPGTGKSCATIQMIRARAAEMGRLPKVLVLGPQVVLKNWAEEFAKFSKIDPKQVKVLEGPIKKRTAFVKVHSQYAMVLITNYDALADEGFTRALVEFKPDIFVGDEIHYCKNYQAKRAKNAQRIAVCAKHRYLLTGTPVLNSGMDLWMQYNILDGHLGGRATFPPNFFIFRNRYFVDENAAWARKQGHFPKWVPRQSTYKELSDKIAEKTLRVVKEDCLDLPPLVVKTQEVGLSGDQKTAYDEMKRDFITWVTAELNSGVPQAVVARLAITKALRLQQIVSGFVKTDDGETLRFKKVPRLDVLKGELELLAKWHKVIVWANFRENYRMIAEVCEELGLPYVEVHGDIHDKASQVKEFEENPEVRVLIGNQGAGGIGINLVAASYSIYYSRGFKLGDDIQSEARNYRQGSQRHEKITRINLVCPGTIDETISRALEKKQELGNEILSFTNL